MEGGFDHGLGAEHCVFLQVGDQSRVHHVGFEAGKGDMGDELARVWFDIDRAQKLVHVAAKFGEFGSGFDPSIENFGGAAFGQAANAVELDVDRGGAQAGEGFADPLEGMVIGLTDEPQRDVPLAGGEPAGGGQTDGEAVQ